MFLDDRLIDKKKKGLHIYNFQQNAATNDMQLVLTGVTDVNELKVSRNVIQVLCFVIMTSDYIHFRLTTKKTI